MLGLKMLKKPLVGVLIFSIVAGISSGMLMATTFMPAYSLHHNWRQWHPGVVDVNIWGQATGYPDSQVLWAADKQQLDKMGLSASRLWLHKPRVEEQQMYALVAHGIWQQQHLRLGSTIAINYDGRTLSVPVAGVWHPFHPQLGDSWLVVVGEVPRAAMAQQQRQDLITLQKPPLLPASFQSRNLLSSLLFVSLPFILFGTFGLVDRKGRTVVIGWGVKLWVGGAVAVPVALGAAALWFRLFWPLPLLSLLPVTFMLLACSYLLAVILLSVLCVLLARLE